MCLIAFRWDPTSQYPLVMGANRDEFYQRPTAKSSFWADDPSLFGGRDLQAGGTWLALSTRGRLAALTNYREPASTGSLSRGELPHGFLTSPLSAEHYLQSIEERQMSYAGFNLLLGDATGLWYFSNREQKIRSLAPGLYGLSNGLLDTPWPKLVRLRTALGQALDTGRERPEDVLALLQDKTLPGDEELPDTGVGPEREKLLGPCFIESTDYGTRNCLGLVMGAGGKVFWHENYFGPEGRAEGQIRQTLNMAPIWPAVQPEG